jgi:hypothetical protein
LRQHVAGARCARAGVDAGRVEDACRASTPRRASAFCRRPPVARGSARSNCRPRSGPRDFKRSRRDCWPEVVPPDPGQARSKEYPRAWRRPGGSMSGWRQSISGARYVRDPVRESSWARVSTGSRSTNPSMA